MTVIHSEPECIEDERGRPMLTGWKRYIVRCDTCDRRIELKSDDGLWDTILKPHGMTTRLSATSVSHICLEHLK